MILDDELKLYLIEADNIYDLVGNCFGALCNNITNHPAFIGEYIDEGSEKISNPNIKSLNEFSERVMEEVHTLSHEKYSSFVENLLQMIDELQLLDYRNSRENQLTVIYCILSAIDAEAANWDVKRLSGSVGPLDRQRKTQYRVYFNMQSTLHRYYAEEVGRERIHASNFSEMFQNFRFIDAGKWFEGINVPEVRFVPGRRTRAKCGENDCKLKVGVIQVQNGNNFEFVKTVGSSFKVSYSNSDQECCVRKSVCALENALKEDCNIIVFPEYVMSPEIYEEIKRCLRENMQEKGVNSNPYLVFAGSTWTDDDNNVMKVLDSCGQELGEYYKYSPFIKREGTRRGFKLYEALQNPGKRCDVFAVDGVGMFLPAICRDVIDAEYTEEIVKSLLPLFVVTAAWSSSVASFEQRQREFANKYFTSSVLANACGPVAKGKIGNGSIVHKEDTIAGVEIKEMYCEKCEDECGTKGCLFIMEYDFFYSRKERINTKICIHKV